MVINLKRKLCSWVENGLISSEQHEKILAHENWEGGRPWVVYGIAGIGVAALITGIVSLIAANWDEIPHWLKLTNYFFLQSGAGYLFVRFEKKQDLWREVFLTLFTLLFFAGIGLIAQIYHLRGAGWEALLMWLVITLPAVLLARSRLVCHIWVVTVLITALTWAFARNNLGTVQFGTLCVLATVPLLLTAFGFLAQQFKHINERFRAATLAWGIGVTFVVGMPLASSLWSIRSRIFPSDMAFLTIPWVALALCGVASHMRRNTPREQKLVMTATLIAAGIYLTIPLLYQSQGPYSEISDKIFGAAGFIAVGALAAASAALARYKRLFDAISFIIAARFIGIYFDVFGSLAQTGLGLIVSGLIILGIAFFWYRFKETVKQWIGGVQ